MDKNSSFFGERVLDFYKTLNIDAKIPRGIEVMNPYRDPRAVTFTKLFLDKFFSDNHKRVLVFGINPGRFGSGMTGVGFTDPIALENFCSIPNDLPKKREFSSIFIYDFIEAWGGPKKFYSNFFITALSPLGFTKDGKNYNFYDHPELLKNITPFMVASVRSLIALGGSTDSAILLGTGKLQNVFIKLNNEYGFFKKIYAVEHPRYIMQYRRKEIPAYLKKYRKVFEQSK